MPLSAGRVCTIAADERLAGSFGSFRSSCLRSGRQEPAAGQVSAESDLARSAANGATRGIQSGRTSAVAINHEKPEERRRGGDDDFAAS